MITITITLEKYSNTLLITFEVFYVKLQCYKVLTFKIIKTDRVFEVIYKAMSYTAIF